MTPVIVPVRPDSVLAGFGPAAAGVAAVWAAVVWVLPASAPVTVVAGLVAAGCALAVRWLTVLVTPAAVDAAAAAGWLATWLPAGCVAAGWVVAGWVVAGWVWAEVPLAAGGGELAAWPEPLELVAAVGWAGAFAGVAGWLGGGAAGGAEAVWAGPDDGAGLGWVRLCTAPLAAPVRELSADPAPLEPGEPESVAADARPARRNAKISAAEIPPQAHRKTLRARPKARERVADPSTARRLHRAPIIIHTYPPVLSGQNRRGNAGNLTHALPDHTRKVIP